MPLPVDQSDASDPAQLRAYVRTKQEIARAVRGLTELLARRGNADAASECHNLMVKLAEDRFTLAVVGQFKRGKSSLMNAIIGRDLLPTGLLPITSAITILRFGPRERLVIAREGFLGDEEAPVSALPEYVTEEGNPGNRKKIKAVYVEVPAAFLRRGLEFVDTPGIGSAIEANTAATMSFVPQCDAVLFVTSVESPMSAAEIEFLRSVHRYVRKIFFVLNKVDLLDPAELAATLSFVAARLRQSDGGEPARVFGVSSRLALDAKLAAHAPEENAAVGLDNLEHALAEFLATEKSNAFLAAIVDKALRVAAQGLGDARLQRDLIESPTADVRQRLAWLVDAMARLGEQKAPEAAAPPDAVDPTGDLPARACPVCAFLRRRMFDFFAGWKYALATDEHVQAKFAADAGFCPFHTWQLAAVASPLGLSNGYPKLADRLSGELDRAARDPAAALRANEILTARPDTCRACRAHRESVDAYVHRPIRWLGSEAARDAYSRCAGLCLPHLRLALATRPGDDLARLLLAVAARGFDHLSDDMQSYAIKRDATRRQLLSEHEHQAYLRMQTQFAGDRYLSDATNLSQAEVT